MITVRLLLFYSVLFFVSLAIQLFFIQQWIRSLSEEYVARGLPNFPEGIPFTFWEQYISLKYNLLVCICIITAAVFVVISILLMSPWTAAIIVGLIANIYTFGLVENQQFW